MVEFNEGRKESKRRKSIKGNWDFTYMSIYLNGESYYFLFKYANFTSNLAFKGGFNRIKS